MTTAVRTSRNSPPATAPGTTKRAVYITAALIAVAIAVALIVALAAGGSEKPESVGAGEAAHIPTGSLRQVSSAETIGAALPKFDGTLVSDPATGSRAPDITASYFDNKEVTVNFDDGQPRIVMFLAHWCPHCQAEVSSLVPWFEANDVPQDVEIIAISTSVDQGAPNYPPSAWFLREGWPVPVLRDSAQADLAAAFGLSSYPYIVAVDGDGIVMDRSSGGLTTQEWEAALAAVAAS